MCSPPTADAWRTVVAADPSSMDRGGLGTVLESLTLVRSLCDAVEVAVMARSRTLSETGNCESPEFMLANETGRSARDARRAASRATACEAAPTFHDALTTGRMTGGHLDAVAAVMGRLDSEVLPDFAMHAPDLIGRAEKLTVDQFERECRDLGRFITSQRDQDAETSELDRQRKASTVKRWRDRQTGMHHTLISLDPLSDSRMWKVLNAATEQLRQQQKGRPPDELADFALLQARAVVAAVTSTPGGSSTATRVPEISVLIDWSVLSGIADDSGLVCETDSGVPLPVSTVRRLCCDAEIFPSVLGADGVVLDQGRGVRTANRDQRRALAAMHASCAFPSCDAAFDICRIHHVRFWWEHLGRTDIDNLLPLCERHHHLVHEGGWRLTMTPDRIATWLRSDGFRHHLGQTVDRRPADVPMLR